MTSRIRKYLALSPAQQCLFWQALIMLAWYRAVGLRLSLRRLTRCMRRHPEPPPAPALAPAQQQRAGELARLVAAAASAAPWYCSCLAQVLVLQRLLARRGIPGQICLGATTPGQVAADFAAHAWLRCGDAILSGESGHEAYPVLSTWSWDAKCGPGPASKKNAGFLPR